MLAGVAAGFAAVVLAAPAAATDFCVAPLTGCAGGQQATLQGSLDAALAAPGPDRVLLPAGVVTGAGAYSSANQDNTVDLVGQGREATVLISKVAGYALSLNPAGTVSDLTLRAASPDVPGQFGWFVRGTVERLGYEPTLSSDNLAVTGTVRGLVGTGASQNYLGIVGTGEDLDLRGVGLATWTGQTVIRRARVSAGQPLFGQNSRVVISSSLFISTTPGQAVASFSPSPVPNSQATALLSNVTLIGAGGACIGLDVSGDTSYTAPDDHTLEDATLANAVVRGCPKSLNLAGGTGNETAKLTVLDSDLDLAPGAVTQSGTVTLVAGPGESNLNVDPLFVGIPGALQDLRSTSPLIDRGLSKKLSPEESDTDLNGNARVVDGNGDGTAVRDLGAFEYQRRAPVVTATASAASAELGKALTFSGSATEADPGETITGYEWRFDDGTVSPGPSVTHAFVTPGPHTATLRATDSAGVTGSATATVTVLAVPAVASLTLRPTTFRVVAAPKRGAKRAAARRPGPAPRGTTVTLVLTRPVAAVLTVRRQVVGRRSGKGCAAPTVRNRRARPCVRFVRVSGTTIRRAAGAPSSFAFGGRFGRRALAPGGYRLVAKVAGAPERFAAFRIVR